MTVNRSPNPLSATSQPSTEFLRHWDIRVKTSKLDRQPVVASNRFSYSTDTGIVQIQQSASPARGHNFHKATLGGRSAFRNNHAETSFPLNVIKCGKSFRSSTLVAKDNTTAALRGI
jgi:hypothetical protein